MGIKSERAGRHVQAKALDYFGAELEEVDRSPARPIHWPAWLGWPRYDVLAVVGVALVLVLSACGDPLGPVPRATPELCRDRMASDLANVGRVNESAPECAGLTEDELADVELDVLSGEGN